MPAPAEQQLAEYAVRLIPRPASPHDAVATRFSVAVAAKPEHKLTVKVTERDTAAALGGVEIRLGSFHARTDKTGRAELRVCKGEYQLQLWRTAHIAPAEPIDIDGDASVELTMVACARGASRRALGEVSTRSRFPRSGDRASERVDGSAVASDALDVASRE